MGLLRSLVVTTALLTMGLAAHAGEFIVIDLNDKLMKGNQGPLKIRQLLNREGVAHRKAELLSVMMVAKTKAGRGRAELVVGQDYSASQVVDGDRYSFQDTSEQSFDRVLFKNPKDNSRGKWQIHLRGKFKIRQLVVELGDTTKNVELDYYGEQFRGQQVLTIKRKAKLEGGIIPQDYELMGVTLIAKSRHGGGKATLKVGQAMGSQMRIGGTPQSFNSYAEHTYHEIKMDNPKQNSNGVWQIHLRGNIKVEQVILHLKEK